VVGLENEKRKERSLALALREKNHVRFVKKGMSNEGKRGENFEE